MLPKWVSIMAGCGSILAFPCPNTALHKSLSSLSDSVQNCGGEHNGKCGAHLITKAKIEFHSLSHCQMYLCCGQKK